MRLTPWVAIGSALAFASVAAPGDLRSAPIAPTDLRVDRFESTTLGSPEDRVVLAWSDRAADETAYVIERWGGLGCEAGFTKIGYLPADTETFEDRGVDLLAGTYWWRVKACNDDGCSTPAVMCHDCVGERALGASARSASPAGQRGSR